MRDLRELDIHRCKAAPVLAHYGWAGDETCGVFMLPSPVDGQELLIIASSGEGWDHVSVSRRRRCPNWLEMEYVKHRFFREHEVAMELHVPRKDHVNVHGTCLHLWRPTNGEIPLPPKHFVG